MVKKILIGTSFRRSVRSEMNFGFERPNLKPKSAKGKRAFHCGSLKDGEVGRKSKVGGQKQRRLGRIEIQGS
jgi:hypothetical protein